MVYIGIDISKSNFVAAYPSAKGYRTRTFPNTVAEFDFTGVFERSQDVPPTLRRTWYSHVYDS